LISEKIQREIQMYVYIGIIILVIVIILFVYWRFFFFFRNPDRIIPYDSKSILSPADGFVIYCKKINPGDDIFSIKKNKHIKLDDLMFIDEKDLKNQPGWLIGIFMTFLNVHYNRAPIEGHIEKIRHDFLNKFKVNKRLFKLYFNILFFKKPLWKNCEHIISNERASFVIKNKNLSVYVTQIADSWVNKIVTFKDNEEIKQGEIFGIVKMGSQVDIFVPDNNGSLKVVITEGQRVKAGLTELIRIKN
jgi:phosphatidylserine decarboxylase